MPILELAKELETVIASQEQSNDASKVNSKEVTKSVLFRLLQEISVAPKDELSAETRQQLDGLLSKHATILKWPLLRSLSSPNNYRAFLGLPNVMEKTRRFLTTASSAKLQEILVRDLDISIIENQQDLIWVEQVLTFMTGDGRRKKDLGGFTLQDKGPVRAALNKVKSQCKKLEEKSKVQQTQQKPVKYELERDVRIVDAERQSARVGDFASLVDDALQKDRK